VGGCWLAEAEATNANKAKEGDLGAPKSHVASATWQYPATAAPFVSTAAWLT